MINSGIGEMQVQTAATPQFRSFRLYLPTPALSQVEQGLG
jgi:hypothetical protein